MSSFALSIMGLEGRPGHGRRQGTNGTQNEGALVEAIHGLPDVRHRSSRRAISYYNSFQTTCHTSNDSPPSYTAATQQKPAPRRKSSRGGERLPGYTCTISTEAKMLLYLESVNPLHGVSEGEWREVYVVLRGTLLSFYRLKDGGPGRLLRSYTLQHAEVGLAVDTQHSVLIPQSRFANLIPTSARRKAWQKDPDLFKHVRQYILRIRVETDQILLADPSEDRINDFVHSISAGIDISCAIDERSIPRQCTVPRRRRRRHHYAGGDLSDPSLLAEQERILRDMYPAFAQNSADTGHGTDLRRMVTTATTATEDGQHADGRDDDELDLAIIREDFAGPPTTPSSRQADGLTLRPQTSRQLTSSSITSTLSSTMIHSTSRSNFDENGKWRPSHPRTAQQVQRYMRRCMPILLADAVRASDIIICNGARCRINWRMEVLEEWELQPPSYRSHGFNHTNIKGLGLDLTRTQSISQNSASDSGNQEDDGGRQTSSSINGADSEDQITRVDDGETDIRHIELHKIVTSVSKMDNNEAPSSPATPTTTNTGREQDNPNHPVHGVVFCF